MRTKVLSHLVIGTGLALALLALVVGLPLAVRAQGPDGGLSTQAALGTSFTYQGRLTEGGNPASGTYDFQFKLYDAASGGSQVGSTVTKSGVNVADGLFTVELDFGSGAFDGSARWLEVAVKKPSESSYTTLGRQKLTAAPYALALPGLWTEPNATSPNVIGGYSGNSVGTGTWGATIGGGGASGWTNRVVANFGTVGGGYDNLADEAATVGGGLHNAAGGFNATVGGGENNTASGSHATASGGISNTVSGYAATAGGGISNTVSGHAATVGGGVSNTVSGYVATAGGGSENIVSGQYATTGGGFGNTVSELYATVGGGWTNTASDVGATVGGGLRNTAGGYGATAGGGYSNTAHGQYATVGGGKNNTASGTYATVGGGAANAAYDYGATVGGGLTNTASVTNATVGGGQFNEATNIGATVGGGRDNLAGGAYATVGGGITNTAAITGATVSGGISNTVGGYGATVGGGAFNRATGVYATVAGGGGSFLFFAVPNRAEGDWSAVGGGANNQATGFGATVPGGAGNIAGGSYSFAAGYGARANHDGAFVWGDSTNADVYSPAANTFIVRANSGVWFGQATTDITPTIGTNVFISTSTGAYLSTGGVWTDASDRNLKENFTPVDPQAVLEKVAQLPVTTWNYKTEDPSVRHMGPVAQDFYAAFGLGADDTHIAPLDANGVALAAIQGLYRRVQALEAENRALREENAAQQEQIDALWRENAELRGEIEAIKAQLADLGTNPSPAGALRPTQGNLLSGFGTLLIGLGLVWAWRRGSNPGSSPG